MSVCYFLFCEETKQAVHITTTSMGRPFGSMTDDFVIQLFTLSHANKILTVTTDPVPDFIEWDLGNCIELYERITSEKLPEETYRTVSNYIEDKNFDNSEYANPNWLDNYTFNGGLKEFGLNDRP